MSAGDIVEEARGAGGAVEEPSPTLQVSRLSKAFRRNDGVVVTALDDVSLDVHAGEIVVLLGPSGCGKTTLLRSIGGLERPDSGRITIGGEVVFDSDTKRNLSPDRRELAMVFQSYALWPHMTVFANVAFPLQSLRYSRSDIKERVERALDVVGIPHLAKQFPGQMSGGQQQRVAVARAIVVERPLVLFDEPLSNVDAKVRAALRLELLTMQRALKFASVYVTHDQIEAMEMGHRIGVMSGGRIIQLDTPRRVYERPQTRYTADFIGSSNALTGTVTECRDDKSVRVRTALGEVHSSAGTKTPHLGEDVALMCRPENCAVSFDEPVGPNRWRGVVQAALFVGPHTEIVVGVGDHTFHVWRGGAAELEPGSGVWFSVAPENVLVLPDA